MRLLIAAIAVFTLALCAWAQTSADEKTNAYDPALEAEILISAARNAVHLGDLNLAIRRYALFVKENPDDDDGRLEYADVLFQAGLVRQAVVQYEKLIAKYPDDLKINRSLVDALLNVGDHPRAKAQLAESLQRFPNRTDFALSLALLHALDGETPEAEAIVDRYIKGRPLTNDKMRLEAASLYVQLKKPQLAGPIIDELLVQQPDDAKVLALAVRYALLTGNTQLAMRLAQKLDRLYPGNVELRLELASALYAAGDYSKAGRYFAEALRREPKNQAALLGSARVALQDYRVDLADDFLDRVPEDVRGRQWQLACAERDTIAGNYLRATCFLNQLLTDNPSDSRASMALADLDRAENEFIKADCRYYQHDALGDNTAAGHQYAVSLMLQDRFCAAEQVCRHVLSLNPEDSRTMIVLARVLVELNRCGEAAELMRQAQQIDNNISPEAIYYSQFISPDFISSQLEQDSDAKKSDRLSTAHSSLDSALMESITPDESTASDAFSSDFFAVDAPNLDDTSPGDSNSDAQTRPVFTAARLYDMAMGDGRRCWARQVLDAALQHDPQNVVLLTRLAEWHASFGLPREASCAAGIYEQLLSCEPSNQKWILGLARAYATMRCYDRALQLYHQLRCQSPANYPYARETARVVFHVCGTDEAMAEYDSALCCWPGFEEEARRLSCERCAKKMHYCSPSIASSIYSNLLCLEPYEPHFAFEMGQTFGNLGCTHRAIGAYSYLLAHHPNHRNARIAIEGKCLDLRPQLFMDHAFVRERGRQGLTSIDRLGEYFGCRMPWGDENEYLMLGYGLLNLAPTYGESTYGDALLIRAQKELRGQFGSWFSPYAPCALFIDCEVQSYDRLVATRPEFEAGFKFRSFDDCVWTISGVMQNVLENGESLRQDIYRGGLRAAVDFMPNNYWESQVLYELYGYSDNNLRQAAELRNRLQLTPDPRRFSMIMDFVYWDIRYPSVFSPGPDPFFDMIHPYWTPQNFAMTGVGIEWKEWLSHDRFDGADHCWVSFSAMKRWDSQKQNYTIFRGMFVWDITRRLSGYASAEYNNSAPYQSTRAYAGLSWIF